MNLAPSQFASNLSRLAYLLAAHRHKRSRASHAPPPPFAAASHLAAFGGPRQVPDVCVGEGGAGGLGAVPLGQCLAMQRVVQRLAWGEAAEAPERG